MSTQSTPNHKLLLEESNNITSGTGHLNPYHKIDGKVLEEKAVERDI